MNGELSFWNDESVKRDVSEEMKVIIWKRYAGTYFICYYNYADYMSINSYISGCLWLLCFSCSCVFLRNVINGVWHAVIPVTDLMCYHVDMVKIIITIYQYEYLCSIHFIIQQLDWFILDLVHLFWNRLHHDEFQPVAPICCFRGQRWTVKLTFKPIRMRRPQCSE